MSSIIVAGDTSGAITIAAPAVAGTNTLTLPASTGTFALTGASVARSQLPAGSVLQVVSAIKSDRFTTASGTAVDITGYTATITPNFSTSKILVISSFHISGGSAGAYPRTQLLRGATAIGLGDASGSGTQITAGSIVANSADNDILNISYSYLDSPATVSATTYKWQMYTFSGRTGTFNGSTGATSSNFFNSSSTIILMEIAA